MQVMGTILLWIVAIIHFRFWLSLDSKVHLKYLSRLSLLQWRVEDQHSCNYPILQLYDCWILDADSQNTAFWLTMYNQKWKCSQALTLGKKISIWNEFQWFSVLIFSTAAANSWHYIHTNLKKFEQVTEIRMKRWWASLTRSDSKYLLPKNVKPVQLSQLSK